ncbi:MAG: hypothetical protein HYY67_07760 [Thaumarchaeota archaeon]|nr:hypothetical protein [Nitrososphaerota archaeon]
MPKNELIFEYDYDIKTVYDWWTDLSGKGYVGESLKSIEPVGREGEKILVRTRWVIMGMTMILTEKLTLDPPHHWVWEPHMMGIRITDDFRLEEKGNKAILHIKYHLEAKGIKANITKLMFGWFIKRMMVSEWISADKAFKEEMLTNAEKSSTP